MNWLTGAAPDRPAACLRDSLFTASSKCRSPDKQWFKSWTYVCFARTSNFSARSDHSLYISFAHGLDLSTAYFLSKMFLSPTCKFPATRWLTQLPVFDSRHVLVSPDSSVGIATRYGLDGPGIESGWGRVFQRPSRQDLGSDQPPVRWAPALFLGYEKASGWY
jgi:hypothetical protein